jgi:hypothetical protein
MRETQVILNDRHTLITVVHETSDPSNWIVRQWRKSWWRKRRILSEWFIDSDQAHLRAEGMRNVAALNTFPDHSKGTLP